MRPSIITKDLFTAISFESREVEPVFLRGRRPNMSNKFQKIVSYTMCK